MTPNAASFFREQSVVTGFQIGSEDVKPAFSYRGKLIASAAWLHRLGSLMRVA